MRISLRWLRDYVDVNLPAEEIARRLTMAGIEVTAVDRLGAKWDNIFVAEVAKLSPHPNADRLQLVEVDYGAAERKTIVTGATNLSVGDKVPYATVGARLIDGHSEERRLIVLKPIKLRGVLSEGMVCSEKELGIGDEHAGIMILARDARVGLPLADEIGDAILDMDVTPNQVHCMSMIGTAWEVSALTGERIHLPVAEYRAAGAPASELIDVEIVDPDFCPRYSALVVRDVTIGQSPEWMQRRLIAAGVRPINNVVDVSNYVMLETNQPLHAFDYDKLRGKRIIVRRAGSKERLTTLDGVDRELTSEMLVIADPDGPVAIAGVMGGLDSEVSSETTNVLIEAASFLPTSVRRTARALRLPSEAAKRFERGIRAEGTVAAGRRAAQLMQEVAGGEIAPGVVDAYPRPEPTRELVLTPAEVRRLLGIEFSLAETRRVLESLGFGVVEQEGTLLVTVPAFRVDGKLPAELVEDIIRTVGYDRLPSTVLSGPLPEPIPSPQYEREARLRGVMVGCGFAEIIAYTATSRQKLARFHQADSAEPLAAAVGARLIATDVEPVWIDNPLSSEWEVLRTTPFVSILDHLSANLRQIDRDASIFEIGRIYLPRDGDLPEERPVLAAAIGAYRSGRAWGAREENDFFDLKGVAETALASLRLPAGSVFYRAIKHPAFHPVKAAAIVLGPLGREGSGDPRRVVGVVGEVSDELRRAFDIDQRAFMLGLDLGRLAEAAVMDYRYEQLPRFPSVVQDVAIVLDVAVSAESVATRIRRAGQPLVKRVELFDVYEGGAIPVGQRSLAYHITYQAPDRTLTDVEVAEVHHRIERALTGELGAQLRGA